MDSEPSREGTLAGHAQLAGVWANEVYVVETAHEFAFDFVRFDPFQPAVGRPVLVARVACSAILATRLAKLLDVKLDEYTEGPCQNNLRVETADERREAAPSRARRSAATARLAPSLPRSLLDRLNSASYPGTNPKKAVEGDLPDGEGRTEQ